MSSKFGASGEIAWLEAQLVVDTNAYAAGDHIGKAAAGAGVAGNPIALALPWGNAPGQGSGFLIQSVALVDLASQRKWIDVLFYNELPITTFTDNNALDLDDADVPKLIGRAVNITDYDAFADNAIGEARQLQKPAVLAPGAAALYASLVARDAITFAAATDVHLRVGLLRV